MWLLCDCYVIAMWLLYDCNVIALAVHSKYDLGWRGVGLERVRKALVREVSVGGTVGHGPGVGMWCGVVLVGEGQCGAVHGGIVRYGRV